MQINEAEKQAQIEQMWADYEDGGQTLLREYYRKAYRGAPMPEDIRRIVYGESA